MDHHHQQKECGVFSNTVHKVFIDSHPKHIIYLHGYTWGHKAVFQGRAPYRLAGIAIHTEQDLYPTIC